MKHAAFLLLALAVWPGEAAADSGMLMGGIANRQMPLDALSAPTACYSFRRLLTAYTTNKAVNVIRASDSATTDIGFTANGDPDTATLATFFAATTGKVITFYDQCGSRNITQGTDANRPAVALTCIGTNPCFTSTSGSIALLAASNITPATGLVSISAIARRSAGTGTCVLLRENGTNNRLFTGTSANQFQLFGGTSGSIVATAADSAFHAAQGVVNGASSVLSIDGTETTGTATGNTTAGTPAFSAAASTTCSLAEGIIFDNVGLSATQRDYLVKSQRAGWGF